MLKQGFIPAGRDQDLLFLDYDGVLHNDAVFRSRKRGIYLDAPASFSLFQHMTLLEESLRPYPHVRIILATTWVRVLSFSRAVKFLAPALRERVIGATFHSQMNVDLFLSKSRGEQILDDVKRRHPRSWLALDNDDMGWPSDFFEQLICTDDVHGLSPLSTQAEMQAKFKATFGKDLSC